MLVKVNQRGTRGFLEFVKRAMPQTYRIMVSEMKGARQLAGYRGGLGEVFDPAKSAPQSAPTSSLATTLTDIANIAAQVYLTKEQVKAQQSILNMQLDRARQGLAPLPIDPAQYGLPGPSVGVSLDDGTKKILIFGGIGLALALMFGLIGGGRAARAR